jgi:hypothetical protein
LLALGLALLAWRQAAASTTGSGRRPAQAAVFLCLFLIGFAIAVRAMNDRYQYRYAVGCVDHWLEMLRGENPREAYLLTLPPNQRPADPAGQVAGHVGEGSRQVVPISENEFFENPVYAELADIYHRLDLVAYSQLRSNDGRAQYRLLYQIFDTQLASPEQLAMIEVIGAPGPDGRQYWQIGPCQLFDPAADPRGRSF